tara:strand:+ start:424 stop:1020 length:597 start_codon:yes stop_codon:yes gene_type:complete
MENWQTGDLILFHSKTTIFGRLIQLFTGSQYSHIGVVLKDPKFTEKPLVGMFLWESSDEYFGDAEDHKFKIGVEIVDLNKVIHTNSTNMDLYHRKLTLSESFKLDEQKLKEIYSIVHNKPYDIVPKDWIEAFFRKDSDPQKTDRFWCSALVGYIYTKLGLLPSETDWSMMRPSDFSTENNNLPLLHSSLGPETYVSPN